MRWDRAVEPSRGKLMKILNKDALRKGVFDRKFGMPLQCLLYGGFGIHLRILSPRILIYHKHGELDIRVGYGSSGTMLIPAGLGFERNVMGFRTRS